MSLFKCKDLLEISMGFGSENHTQFKLDKATKEIKKIIQLQSRNKNVKVNVKYAPEGLK